MVLSVEIRRALLLFAIVLGLAAVATSVSQPQTHDDHKPAVTPATRTHKASPRPAPRAPVTLRFDAGAARPAKRTLPAGRGATVTVRVGEPGQVTLEGLGLTASADPLTPARFDVLAERPGRHQVSFTPAGSEEARSLGTLVVKEG
jgi:hypothetical protein